MEKKEQALRFNQNKIEIAQQPLNALAAFATVCMKNSAKYGGKYPNENWRKGAPQSQYLNCMLRHLFQHMSGEVIDPTDGLPHLWKVLWNAAVAVEDSIVHPENNDLSQHHPVDFEFFMKYINSAEISPKDENWNNTSADLFNPLMNKAENEDVDPTGGA